jgi:hypothetical protein
MEIMRVKYKHKSSLYRDVTAVALFLAIIVVTSNWFDNSGLVFIEGIVGLAALLFRALELGKKNEKEVLSITGTGITNQWGTFGWDRIKSIHIEGKHFLLFTAIEKDQTEKAFRYDLSELAIDRKDLDALITHHQNKFGK